MAKLTPQETLDIIKNAKSFPELLSSLGCTRQTAIKKINRLRCLGNDIPLLDGEMLQRAPK